MYEVVVADRGATDGDEHIGIRCPGDVGIEAFQRVASDAEGVRLAAGGPDKFSDGEGDRRDDLVGPARLARQHQFIAGCQDGDMGTPSHRQLSRTQAPPPT